MVRLMPSTATEPLWTIHWRTFSGTRTLRVQSVVWRSKLRAGFGDDGVERGHHAGAVDVALHDVAAERAAGGGGQFEVDACAGSERAERSAVERFLREIGVEVGGVGVERGEADAGDAERVAFAQARGDAGSFDGDAANAATIGEADEGSGLLDDAGEHGFNSKGADSASRDSSAELRTSSRRPFRTCRRRARADW